MSTVQPIAIIGIGCRFPGGVGSPEDLWKLLVNGVDAITMPPKDRWAGPASHHRDVSNPRNVTTRCGGFLEHIDRFDAQFFGINPREAAAADPQHRLLLEVAYEAVEDAGLTLASLTGRRAAVYVGISGFDYGSMQLYANEPETVDAYTNLGAALCIAANRISYFFNLRGPSMAVDTACSSSLVATHLACQSIWRGESELAFAGGVNLVLQPEVSVGFSRASMLSPDGRCKSFDARANGYVRAEGSGIVVLKPLARALADGDRVYAVVRATAVNQDGRTEGISVPSRESQEANIRDALKLAGLAPDGVQYVEAHGTGTPVGDPIEAAALGDVYGKAQKSSGRCVIGSIKSNLGHLESASGIAGLIKTALCLQHGQIPQSLHFENPNPQIPFDDLQLRVAQRCEPWPETSGLPARAGVNSFGFGGTNAHAVLEAPPAIGFVASVPDDGRAWMLPVSAGSEQALSDLARAYLSSLDDDHGMKHAALRDICHSASVKRSHHDFRLSLVARDGTELREQLDAFLQGESRPNTSTGRRLGAPSRPVFVCSGMGQQWWAMGRELLAQEPVFRRAVEQVSEIYAQLAGWSLFEKLTADEEKSKIRNTDVGQPAIFALQVGLAALWRSWGIEPAAVVGHSAGEMAASFIAGALSLEDAVCVTFHRSRLQFQAAGQGAMLAAGITRQDAERLIEGHRDVISLAAVNGARSVTLSGDAEVLAEIGDMLERNGLDSRALQVDVPFHSQKMEPLETELLESLRDIRPRPASIPLFSTVTGTALTGSELDAKYWYRNVREPVLFADAMGELVRAGHRLFLEIGAHPILRNDIAAVLNERAAQGATLCSLRRGDAERATLLGSLGRMYTAGSEIDWRRLFPSGSRAIKLPRYPYQAEVHWRESDRARRTRLGLIVHPLLGNRTEAAKPTWNVKLDTADLGYLTDHRIGASIVFPAAGYIEMALATAREMFGNAPTVLEDIEFQKFLPLDEKTFCRAQVVLDPDLSEFNIYARPDASENSWDLHARGCVREGGRAAPARFDLGSTRARCPHALEKDECQRIFASMGLNYGPAFQGIVRLWRGGGEALAEIHTPDSVTGQLSDYRLHPAVLDACFQSALAVLSAEAVSSRSKGRAFVPVRIERIRFHSSPSDKFFAVARVKEFNAIGLTVDIDLVDEASNLHAEVRGLVCRQTEQRASGLHGALYEYQWQLKPLAAPRSPRVSDHLPPLDELVPILQHESDRLQKRFDRTRFQAEFHAMSRAAAAAYIVRALRTLGFTSQSFASTPIETLAGRLGLAPQYWKWLRLMSKELTAAELASTEDPGRLWKAAWDQFPECQVELMLDKLCGENLPAVLKGEIDPLGLIFPEGGMTAAEQLYQDSPTIRPNNLLAQKALIEIVRRLPEGKMLRILEIGGGTGGMTSFLLPALKEYNTEYVFTDVSPSFIANAQRRFAQYPFVQYRTLDIENDTVEQGFEPHSFDLIIAADVLHATRDLRKTIGRVKHLLASGGRLMLLEVTRPWLNMTLVFGLLRGWWLFEDEDVRTDEPSLSQERWKSLLREAGFDSISGFADGPDAETAQHSLMLARGPQQTSLSPAVARHPAEARVWLIFADGGTADRSSTGAQLALHLEALGDRVIQARFGTDFSRNGRSEFTIRDDKPNDMRRLLDAISRDTPRLAGILHFGSLDTETSEEMTSESLVGSARLGYIGVLHLLQALASTEGLAIDAIWLVTRSAQPIENRTAPLELAQSPLWGLGRVAIAEYQNLRCRLVDLATCSPQEIKALAEELDAGDDTEDEIALHGELRFVHRLLPVSLATLHGTGRQSAQSGEPFGIELRQPGAMDSLSPRPLVRRAPKPDEIEVEIAATGLNFKDLMTAMGMVPKDAITDDTGGRLLGLECAGRVVAVGDDVTEFAVADEVVVVAPRTLATHITIDRRFAAQKPRHLSLEQAATIPIAFVTAFYALHTLAGMRRGERVLIHSAAGGVGLAAVQLALQAGATVFATAGSPEKRQLLSALGATHVMDSRSLAFADEVLDITAGEGVDIVLNSLAGEAIDKSLSVLRPFGRFVEIGLIDIYKNRRIGMRALRKNISLFAVDLSRVFDQKSDLPQSLLREAVGRFGADGLKPLAHRVFPATRVADAFRTMAQAKHVGKLIVSVKDMEGIRLERVPRSATIDPKGSYLITGGLGGFGLAIAERLARGGAGHIVLASRSAASSSVQTAIASMRQPGVEITTCQMDVTKLEDVQRAIAIAQKVAPLRGILHAAMVLDDAPIERLTEQRMWQAMAPKIMGAWNLHSLTADMALDFFVMFSSFTSIVGNLGQANYVAGNAFLDMLAYYRRSRGLPALTVNWGNVGGAGYVARNKDAAERLERIGTTAMPIAETLDLLEDLMAGDAVQVGVAQLDWNEVGQLMGDRIPARLAGLRSEAGTQTDRSTSDARLREILAADGAVLPSLLEGYIRDHLARAIGASPARIDVHQSLLSLGLDSLIAVEVRNRINADLGMNVPLAKIIQSESINALASYIAERLLERRRGESSAPVFTGAAVDSTGEELGSLENEATLVAPIRGGVAHRQLEASETNHAAAE